ncbi:MAG: tRNA (guanosine(37)-N1)-methyltransferase TrmD [Dehalococcoidia bacterium]
MNFHILTLFPKMISPLFEEGVISRALKNKTISICVHDIREYSSDKHNKVDGYPFGGGPGMLLRPEPIFKAVETLWQKGIIPRTTPIILMSPQGRKFNHGLATELSKYDDLVLICGRYEGFDERIRTNLITDEISIGDFILSGGEIAASAVVDSVSRLIPGVLGDFQSAENDSFFSNLLQYPQFTRPADFRGHKVPDILLSGNHAHIEKWRKEQSITRTKKNRPDLLEDNSPTNNPSQFNSEHNPE